MFKSLGCVTSACFSYRRRLGRSRARDALARASLIGPPDSTSPSLHEKSPTRNGEIFVLCDHDRN